MADESALLERVLLRLASAIDDKSFQNQLHGLLAPLLLKAASDSEPVRKKLMAVLSHVNQMLNSYPQMQLPIEALQTQLLSSETPAASRPLTRVYFRKAFERLPLPDRIARVPDMLRACPSAPHKEDGALVLKLAIPYLPKLTLPSGEPETRLAALGCEVSAVHDLVLTAISTIMLLRESPQQFGDGTTAATFTPAPGLSQADVTGLVDAKGQLHNCPTREDVLQLKLGLIKLLNEDRLFAPQAAFYALLCGAGSAHEDVSDRALTAMRRKNMTLDDSTLIQRVLFLFGGTVLQPGQVVPPETRQMPASPKLQTLILKQLVAAPKAAECFPQILQTVFTAVGHRETRIRSLGLRLMRAVAAACPVHLRAGILPLFLAKVRAMLDDQQAAIDLAGEVYQTLGALGRAHPAAVKDNIDLLRFLFTRLQATAGTAVGQYVLEALKLLRQVYADLSPAAATKLLHTLTDLTLHADSATKVLAVQYLDTCFPPDHVDSRLPLLLAMGDDREDVRQEARRGLRLSQDTEDTTELGADTKEQMRKAPAFAELLAFLHTRITDGLPVRKRRADMQPAWSSLALPYSVSAMRAILQYLSRCWERECEVVRDATGGASATVSGGIAVGGGFRTENPDWEQHRLDQLHGYAQAHPDTLAQYADILTVAMAPNGSDALRLEAIESFLDLFSVQPSLSQRFAVDCDRWCLEQLDHAQAALRHRFSLMMSYLSLQASPEQIRGWLQTCANHGLAEQQRSIPAIDGHLRAAAAVLAWSKTPMPDNLDMPKAILSALEHPSPVLRGAAAESAMLLHRYRPDAVPRDSPLHKRLLQLAAETSDSAVPALLMEQLLRCVGAMFFLALPERPDDEVIQAIMKTSERKSLEINMAAGDVLALLTAGCHAKAACDPYFPAALAPAPDTSAWTASAAGAATAALLDTILNNWCNSSKAPHRSAAAVWLLRLLKSNGHLPELQPKLGEIQTAFVDVLAEGNDITQALASDGISLCYEMGTTATKRQLVDMLVENLSKGGRAKHHRYDAGSEDAVFAHGEVGKTVEGTNLKTYKELCSLASELNKPDLIYRFMSLANHQATWNAKKGAASGFAHLATLASEELEAYLPKLIPKLYRYRFDPASHVQNAMEAIWKALVRNPTKAVDQHFAAILEDLVENLTSSQWRLRESAAAAMADLLRGRGWSELEDHFEHLWLTLFRVVDDIKESVREAALNALKRLQKNTITICKSAPASAPAAMQVLLTVLLDVGLISRVKTVKAISLETLVDVSKEAGAALKPHAAMLIATLLEALSGTESGQLDYLSNALNDDHVSNIVDEVRTSMHRTSPLAACLDDCIRLVDADVLPTLMPKLVDLIKKGLGTSTRAGCARVVMDLVRQCREDLRPYCNKLLKALVAGAACKSAPLQREFARAFATVARVASAEDCAAGIKRARKNYLLHENADQILACAAIYRALGQFSNDVAADQATLLLPVTFYGTFDENKTVSQLFKDAWENHPGSEQATLRLYHREVLDTLKPKLEERDWSVKRQAAACLSALCQKLEANELLRVRDALMEQLLVDLAGRIWDGKAELISAVGSIAQGCQKELNHDAKLQIMSAVLKECTRKRREYRQEALQRTAAMCDKLRFDFWGIVPEELRLLARGTPSGAGDRESSDEDDDEVGTQAARDAQRARQVERASQREERRLLALRICTAAWPSRLDEAAQTLLHEVLQQGQLSTLKMRLALSKLVVRHLEVTGMDQTPYLEDLQKFVASLVADTHQSRSRIAAVEVLKAVQSNAVALWPSFTSTVTALQNDGEPNVRARAMAFD